MPLHFYFCAATGSLQAWGAVLLNTHLADRNGFPALTRDCTSYEELDAELKEVEADIIRIRQEARRRFRFR